MEQPTTNQPDLERQSIDQLRPGDIIYAATDIKNDGSVPELETDALIAAAGCRGVLINSGHLEEDESQSVYLVRFEDADKTLLPAVGCWPQELTTELSATQE